MTNPSRAAARTAARTLIEPTAQLLQGIGIPCDGDGTADTPRRLLNALMELTAGARKDPARHLARVFPPEDGDNLEPALVAVPGISIAGICEHHALPYFGTALVAYVPALGSPVVGLSKLARLAQEYAARPTVQERVGQQIVDAITTHLRALGAAALIRATHTCLTLRGACARTASMTTMHVTGQLRKDPVLHAELLATWSTS
ncbi:GTP cyclohydrolase I [Nonomuraea sp. NPDC051941]|uniref:GTP cyclohydrolase I n=1 Tax=Nonomuraea sp. NPDC051941 TaxID=3364373 RepID=UPI0037CCA1AC